MQILLLIVFIVAMVHSEPFRRFVWIVGGIFILLLLETLISRG